MTAKEEIKFNKKKKLGSYPYFSVVFSITLALFVIELFAILMLYSNKMANVIRSNIEVQVYLDKNISESNITRLQNILSNSDYISRQNGQPQLRFISKEEAAEKFMGDTGENIAEFLGDNPLHDAFVFKLNPDNLESSNLMDIKKTLTELQGVYEVTYLEDLVNSINQNTAKISLILLGFALIMIFIVVILINNTIKLALFSQRFLIRSMQLVGAKSGFIQWPFLKRSLFHGFLGGMLSSFIIYMLLDYSNSRIEGLKNLQNNIELLILFVSISVLGSLIGFVSTFRSIRKYLKLSLDELY